MHCISMENNCCFVTSKMLFGYAIAGGDPGIRRGGFYHTHSPKTILQIVQTTKCNSSSSQYILNRQLHCSWPLKWSTFDTSTVNSGHWTSVLEALRESISGNGVLLTLIAAVGQCLHCQYVAYAGADSGVVCWVRSNPS